MDHDVVKTKNFLPLLSGVVAPILTSFIVILFLWFGLPLWFVLSLLAIHYGLKAHEKKETVAQYIKNFMVLLVSLTAIIWIYHYTGMYGVYGLLAGVLLVTGILLYKRRALILSLVQLWEKTFLGETMEERIEKKKTKMKQ